jgi:leukotriene A-4 hydrolase/aminopeptidase
MIKTLTTWALALCGILSAQQPAATAPVAAAESNDPHSYARPAEARTTSLALDWTVDFTKKQIAGTAKFIVVRAPGVKQVVLDTRDLVIEAAETEKGPTTFTVGPKDAILGAPLRVDLPEGAHTVTITYRTGPAASGLLWLAPEQTATKKHPYLFSQAQAIHARSFIPCQDSPGIRIEWSAAVHVPKGMRAVMSAERTELDDGFASFHMKHPVAPYLIAIAVGDLRFAQIGPRTGVWAEAGVVMRGAAEFSDLEKMIEAIESKFGPYRWGRYDVLVLPPSFPFGGMENPMMTFATPTLLAGDKSLVAVIAHELAHSWSGNLVTNATWRDFWLNEGFTVYLENRILERLYGERVGTQHRILGKNELLAELEGFKDKPGETKLWIDLEGRDPDDGMTTIPYEKGALFLETLERAVGREKFDPFLKSWFDDHAFKSVTTPQFEAFLKARLFGGDQAAMDKRKVRQWLYEPGLPDNAPSHDQSVFDAPTQAAAELAAGKRAAKDLGAEKWTTNEWLHFLKHLPKGLPQALVAELDAAWKLTASGNAEITTAWLEIAIAAKYEAAYPRLEEFLVSVGRRKFLKPLYAELAKTPDGLVRARKIYERARPGYHAIATQTLDKMLLEPESKPAK